MSLPSIHSSSLPRFVTATPVSESASIVKHRSNLSALFELNKKIIVLSGQICGMQQESRNAKNVEEKMKQACLNASAAELPTLYAQARELSQKNKQRETELPVKELQLAKLKDEFNTKKECLNQQIQIFYDLEQEDLINLSSFERTLNKRIAIAQKSLEEAFDSNPETFIQAKVLLESLKGQLSAIEKVRQTQLENSAFIRKQNEIFNVVPEAKSTSESVDPSKKIPLVFNSYEIVEGNINVKTVKFNFTPLVDVSCRYELVVTKTKDSNEGILELCAVPGESLQNPHELTFIIDKNMWEGARKAFFGFPVYIIAKDEKGDYPRVCQF